MGTRAGPSGSPARPRGGPQAVCPQGRCRGGEATAGAAAGVRPQQGPSGDTLTNRSLLSHTTPQRPQPPTDHLPADLRPVWGCLRNLHVLLPSRRVGVWRQLSATLLPPQGGDCPLGVSQDPASRGGLGCAITSRPSVKDSRTRHMPSCPPPPISVPVACSSVKRGLGSQRRRLGHAAESTRSRSLDGGQ